MTKAGERLRKSLGEAIAFLGGDKSRGRTTNIHLDRRLDVRAIRRATRMKQTDFAVWLRVDVRTLRDWESGRAEPQGSVRTLLEVVGRDPAVVFQASAAE